MNTFDFVVGQLLSFEMMQLTKQRPTFTLQRNSQRYHLIKQMPKERIVDNQLLFILFLVVSLIANFTVMAAPEK